MDILQTFEHQIKAGTVVPIVEFSKIFLSTAPPKYFDFIYLDTSHEYHNTIDELSLIPNILKPNGILLGDDWREDISHKHYGVTKAVKEFIAAGRCKLLFTPINLQWGVTFNE